MILEKAEMLPKVTLLWHLVSFMEYNPIDQYRILGENDCMLNRDKSEATPAAGAETSASGTSNPMSIHREAILIVLDEIAYNKRSVLSEVAEGYKRVDREPALRADSLAYKVGTLSDLRAIGAIRDDVQSRDLVSHEWRDRVVQALHAENFELALDALTKSIDCSEFEERITKWREASSPYFIEILDALYQDKKLMQNLEFGVARPGHPEGSIEAHVHELNENLLAVVEFLEVGLSGPMLSMEQLAAIQILIICHDSFKGQAKAGVGIMAPFSHASLARAFLATYTADESLLNMVQRHDEPFALFKKRESSGVIPQSRLDALFKSITDWDTFILFQIIDNTTVGKVTGQDVSATSWFISQAAKAGLLTRDYQKIEDAVRAKLSDR